VCALIEQREGAAARLAGIGALAVAVYSGTWSFQTPDLEHVIKQLCLLIVKTIPT